EEQVKTVLKTLNKLGFNLKFDDKKVSELVDLRAGLITKCCTSDERFERAQDEIWSAEELDLLTKDIATEFAGTLLMSDEDFVNQQKTREKIRNLLHSLTPK
ncbi:MAG: hypothetical protein OEZ40_08350, partial [Candidatus Bathyarchaeota archaeon]|nr:hypothetical protein [Candidatus Bathyarchaeota archaeon]